MTKARPGNKRKSKSRRRPSKKKFDIWDVALIVVLLIGAGLIVMFKSWEELAYSIGVAIVDAIILGVVITRIITKAMK